MTAPPSAFDFGDFLARLASRWRVYLIVAVITGALMFGLTFMMPTWYRSTAVLLPPEETEQISTGLSVQRFLSRMPSLGALPGYYTPSDIYRAILSSRTVQQAVAERFDLSKVYRQKTMERTLQEFRKHAHVLLSPDGTISVAVEDRSREQAAQMANAMLEELDHYNVERRSFQAKRTRIFLERRVSETDSLARVAEAELRRYQEEHHVVVPMDENTSIRPLADLMARKISLEVQLSVLRSYLREENEAVMQVRNELGLLNRQIATMPRIENELARLVRDVRLYQQVYQLLSGQLEDALLRETMDIPTVTVLDRAVPSERRARPVRRLWVLAAMVLATLGAALWTERPRGAEREVSARPG